MFTHRLLVVDDDRHAREALVKVLQRRQVSVDLAKDGRQALKLAEGTPYSLAILDYQLPDMTGAEVLRAVRSILPNVPAIFVTAYATIDNVFPAIDAGAHRVLAKPFDADELLEAVDSLLTAQ